ncbi:TetR/AcrR family transcriptional regulator [Ulvibacter antarcticus]|uniref:TetR family transcriptional regulator n=1 Tax=Ulvibacter antarcticus TaxID=442714 RepID=A0A3L9Z3V8_9FLAO|nr:TetR/AcrR family transcriptional regulator [Ulvibacter antarcticus]RMA66109.1 TetR family transcriptional regulator [Ulvibacter antarcticus]
MQNERDRIIIKTLALFKKYGVKSVSMDDIAHELSISKKTLYVHFGSKELLIEQTVNYIFSEHFKKIGRILEKIISPLEKIILIYHYGINRLLSYDPAFYSELKKYHVATHICYENNKKTIVFDIIQGLLEEAQKVNEIRKDVNLELFCQLHLYKIDKILANPDFNNHYGTQQMLNHLIIFNLRGILVKPEQMPIYFPIEE